jgi:heme-degrading monooxygenase HmoA
VILPLLRASYDATLEAEVGRMIKEELIPAVKKLPGFQHFHGGFDRRSHRLVAISIWDTEEHSQAIMAQRAGFEGRGVKFDPAETFEVTDEV